MLERIEVDGFRSLREFKFDLVPGLNILVGPNGAGKTNIITFFEFISQLSDHDVADAIHRIGGVASVLHRDAGQAHSQISFRISGFSRASSYTSSETRLVKYEYSASIIVSEELSDIFFGQQSIRLRNTKFAVNEVPDDHIDRWDLDISTTSNGDEFDTTINRLDQRKITVLVAARFAQGREEAMEYIQRGIRREPTVRMSLLTALESYFPNLRNIRADLRSGEVYNVYPGSVKAREDISTPVGVQPDGSGTAATLLALSRLSARARAVTSLQSGSGSLPILQRARYRLVPTAFLDIKKLLSLVNPSIIDVTVTLDSVDGYIKVIFHIDSVEGRIQVPLQRMSDGTVKWLALVTAIRTNRSMFAVEEPENYLHPYMQREIIEIIRSAFPVGRSRAFALISTHSETLLNAVRPEELVVVSMENGRTLAERPQDVENINKVISETGFGLGTIYVGGGLENFDDA